MPGTNIERLDAIINIISATNASLDNLTQPLPNGVFFIVDDIIKKGDGRLWVDTPVWLSLSDIETIKILSEELESKIEDIETEIGSGISDRIDDLEEALAGYFESPSVNMPAEVYYNGQYSSPITNYHSDYTYTISFNPTDVTGRISDAGQVIFNVPSGFGNLDQNIICTITVTDTSGMTNSFPFNMTLKQWEYETDQVIILSDSMFHNDNLIEITGGFIIDQ